jgi:phosphoribosyl 1,2-cyclic phosphodiesterase
MTDASSDFSVTFWGVRGTIPATGKDFIQYGGNTSCLEVRIGKQLFILDAGSGIRALGDQIKGTDTQIDILFSHSHIDHIAGLPFFAPAYDADTRIDLWAGHLRPQYDLLQVVRMIMAPPIFPITPQQFEAEMRYHDFHAGMDIRTSRWLDNGITIRTLPLPHPDQATGYRIEYGGKSLCYITDIEHTPGEVNQVLAAFVQGCSCLIYDGTYCDEEFERYVGWGHSTWQEAVRVADAAQVEQLIVFHHDPQATDAILDTRQKQLTQKRANALMAKEAMHIDLIKT